MEFNIEDDSKILKSLVSQYDSDLFLADIAVLLSMIPNGRIPIYPFQGLDSPLRQLTYIGSLNLSSDPANVKKQEVSTNDEWREIVKQTIKAKAGYFDLFIPKDENNEDEFNEYYNTALPVFLNYFDTGSLNFEEQEIDRISKYFSPFDEQLINHTELRTKDFLNIYEIIDEYLFENLNEPLYLIRSDEDCKKFSDAQKKNNIPPSEWRYEGQNTNIKRFIQIFQDRGERFKIDIKTLYEKYPQKKVDQFFKIFTSSRQQSDYLYYTHPNIILRQPLYQLKDGRHLIIDIKQLIHAIYNYLLGFVVLPENGLSTKFYEHRGKILQLKVEEVFNNFFDGKAIIHNEYKTEENGEAQDLLILYKGLSLIVEVKSKKAAIPHSYPKDIKRLFLLIVKYFKSAIQEGYDQCYRVKEYFINNKNFNVFDLKGKKKHLIHTKKYHSVFTIIVTEEKFRKPQIDLFNLLNLNEDDNEFPFSVGIDDLEIILLSMKKLNFGIADFIKFLKLREKLHGRLDCDDELEIWGCFFSNKKFTIPDDENYHFKTFPEMSALFDELYKKGIGFENEKNLDKKLSGKWIIYDPGQRIVNRGS